MDSINALLGTEMNAVNDCIRTQLASDVALVNQISHYIVSAGGKRLRPALVLLAAKASGYQGQHHIDLAAIIEFIHTATLLHDDVVDESAQRRGRDTANTLFGNAASVLVGDFLYSRSFQMMVRLDAMAVMQILADATNAIAEGEVLQLMTAGNADTDRDAYFEVIRNKTARLFAAAAELGAVIAGRSPTEAQGMADFGMHLGMAFQIADDVLDYVADEDDLGKNLGDDLAEGKMTLPLIIAMEQGSDSQRETIRDVVENGGIEDVDRVLPILQSTNAIEQSLLVADQAAEDAVTALSVLPSSEATEIMGELARFSVRRSA